ncbi:MAG TPA: PRC-barrel domain-containing protein [Armatimonadota bacterium]|jgi:uncharacterized protein YrrD
MKTLHDLLGMPLMTVQEGLRLGTLKGLEFAAADGRVRYLHFVGAETRADGVLPWASVRSVGTDAITVDSVSSVLEAVPPSKQPGEVTADVHDRPVITEGGTHLGKVTDYDINEVTGRIERYRVATGGFVGRLTHSEIAFPHDAVRAFGQDAVIVADDVNPAPGAEKSK